MIVVRVRIRMILPPTSTPPFNLSHFYVAGTQIYLLPDFREGVSIFFLQVPVVKVGEGGWRGESSRFPQLPNVKPGHTQQHEEAH